MVRCQVVQSVLTDTTCDDDLQGRLSPSWESISAPRHIFLTLCNFHSVTAFELPLYQPSPAEQSDPVLYAKNVREYMVSLACQVAVCIAASCIAGTERLSAAVSCAAAQLPRGSTTEARKCHL